MLLLVMAAARLAAVFFLVVIAAALPAQNTSRGRVVITVVDQSGAVIPGAHVGIIQLPSVKQDKGDWLHYALYAPELTSASTGVDGKATVVLAKGSYAIAISQRGFQHHFERIKIRDESSQFLRATLVVGHLMCGVCVRPSPEIPLEPIFLASLSRSNRYRRSLHQRANSQSCGFKIVRIGQRERPSDEM